METWKVVRLPAIAEEDEVHEISTPYGVRRFERKAGEALHPERESLATLEHIQQTIGMYNFAGQYQQQPAPLGGGLVKVEWFRIDPPGPPMQFETVVQSWDTANKPTELSDYSVCTTWGVKGKHFYLLNVYRKHVGYPELKRAVREQADAFGAKTILIEDRASGTQLIQELSQEGLYGIQRYEPKMDKVMRMYSVTSTIENGFVHLPEDAHWLDDYVHELTTFPMGKYDDQVDSTSQALDWLKQRDQYCYGVLELWKQQAEAMGVPLPPKPALCPKCNAPLTRYGDRWHCNRCGASGVSEKPGTNPKPEKCDKCGRTLFVKIGQQWRCQHCGKMYGKVEVQRPMTRAEFLRRQGW